MMELATLRSMVNELNEYSTLYKVDKVQSLLLRECSRIKRKIQEPNLLPITKVQLIRMYWVRVELLARAEMHFKAVLNRYYGVRPSYDPTITPNS